MLTYKAEPGTVENQVMAMDWQSHVDPRLRGMLLELDEWTVRKYDVSIIITCLNRSVKENNAAGGVSWSAHLFGRAADIRCWTFTAIQINSIIKHLHDIWGTDFVFVKYHNSGSGPHIHINIKYNQKRGQYGRPQKGETDGT